MGCRICWCAVAAIGLVSAATAAQTTRQQVIARNYDTSKPFTFDGALYGQATLRPPAPVYLIIAKEDSRGRREEWAVEGDAIDQMRKAGYSDDIVRVGASVTVHGFRARPEARVADTIPGARRGALERVMDLAKQGRIMYGTQITLADGKKVPFGSAVSDAARFRIPRE